MRALPRMQSIMYPFLRNRLLSTKPQLRPEKHFQVCMMFASPVSGGVRKERYVERPVLESFWFLFHISVISITHVHVDHVVEASVM